MAALAVSELCDQKIGPNALILEAPFNNLRDVVRHHPFSIPLRYFPYFDLIIVDPLIRSGLIMNTDERLKRFSLIFLIYLFEHLKTRIMDKSYFFFLSINILSSKIKNIDGKR